MRALLRRAEWSARSGHRAQGSRHGRRRRSLGRWLRPRPFDKARGLRVGALTRQGGNRDLVSLGLVNIPYDDAVHARGLDKADLQFGLNHRDIAGDVFPTILPFIPRLAPPLQLLPDRLLADARSPPEAAILDNGIVGVQGGRRG